MAGSAIIHTPVDADIERKAAAVLAEMGLTVAEAVSLMLKRVAVDGALPFEPFAPNAVTVAAMRDAHTGGLKRFDSVAELMAELDADD